MDFQTLASREYLIEEEFLDDLEIIFKNCCTFNLVTSEIWRRSKILWEYSLVAWKFYKEHQQLPEKNIDISRLNQLILLQIAGEIFSNPISIPFRLPVDLQAYPTYAKIIKSPMDLQTITIALQEGSNNTGMKFIAQIKQITKNCIKFNGKEAEISRAAIQMESRKYFYLKKTGK
jgi:hypothetical protein